MLRKITIIGILFLFAVTAAYAAEDDKKTAVQLVEQAAALYKAQGKEATLKEISTPKGQFDKGEIYVFAYDLNGIVAAHPKNPKLIGKNLVGVPDADGKLFRKDIVEMAKAKGTGWVAYKYKNPKENKVEKKTTYLQKVGEVILCCGVYE
jgi:cytochrome c